MITKRSMRSLRLAILAVALVLVPTLARAQQQVEHRDATRLSIRHSWLGVAPPTKASVAPMTIAVLPVPAALPAEPARSTGTAPVLVPVVRRLISPDAEPLRGPPSSAR